MCACIIAMRGRRVMMIVFGRRAVMAMIVVIAFVIAVIIAWANAGRDKQVRAEECENEQETLHTASIAFVTALSPATVGALRARTQSLADGSRAQYSSLKGERYAEDAIGFAVRQAYFPIRTSLGLLLYPVLRGL